MQTEDHMVTGMIPWPPFTPGLILGESLFTCGRCPVGGEGGGNRSDSYFCTFLVLVLALCLFCWCILRDTNEERVYYCPVFVIYLFIFYYYLFFFLAKDIWSGMHSVGVGVGRGRGGERNVCRLVMQMLKALKCRLYQRKYPVGMWH